MYKKKHKSIVTCLRTEGFALLVLRNTAHISSNKFLLPTLSLLNDFFCLLLPAHVSSRTSGVRREGSRSWDESRGHRGKASARLLTGQRQMEQKNWEVPEFCKWTEKKMEKKNKVAPKYLHFLLPMFDILFVFTCSFFFLEVTEKYLGKNENIFAKMTGSPLEEQVCVYYHNSLCVKSDVLIPSVCPQITRGTNTRFFAMWIKITGPLLQKAAHRSVETYKRGYCSESHTKKNGAYLKRTLQVSLEQLKQMCNVCEQATIMWVASIGIKLWVESMESSSSAQN